MKSAKEVAAEIRALKTMKPNVRQYSVFGDDNHAAIDAQIDVLENALDEDEIDEKYGECDNSRSSALQAFDWAEGNEAESPSDDWISLLKN